MFLSTSIAGRTGKKREILYDGEVCLLEKEGRVLSVTSCFVYEMRFNTLYASDSVMLEAGFIVELAYEYQDREGSTLSGLKKLSCLQRFYPGFGNLSGMHPGHGRMFIVPLIEDMSYRYSITGDGMGIRLTISAAIEFIAASAYYSNIFECGKEQPEPGTTTGSINWQSVFDNTRLEDVLACLESLVRLIKIRALFREQEGTGEPQSLIMKEDPGLRAQNQTLEEGLQSCRMTIAHLQSELRERDEIITGLLALLDKGRHEQ